MSKKQQPARDKATEIPVGHDEQKVRGQMEDSYDCTGQSK